MNNPTPNGDGGEERRLPPYLVEENGVAIYRGKTPFDELPFPDGPPSDDFEWACNDPDLKRQYGGLVLAVHARRVWGVGKDYDAAWEDATSKPGCPADTELVFVPV